MAVYKKTYRPYQGDLTPRWRRLLVIPRYAFEDLHRSRFLNIFYLASFIYPLIAALIIYAVHNASVLKLFNAEGAERLISINVVFFQSLLGWQSMLALFLASFIGPGQISPDLANNALSLYLARPFSRVEYVASKMAVLLILLSLMTWIPGLLLFALQSYLEGGSWMFDHGRIAAGLFFGSWAWILLLALLALALSAWVKWKPVAGGLMFGVFFVGAAFGAVVNNIQDTNWGHLLNVGFLVGSLWQHLFEGTQPTTNGAVFFRVPSGEQLPLPACAAMLALLALACLYMLARKIRGADVVR
ncbi:MAG: ABC-2 transporter permease [Bryobacteraceae bacterium]